MVSRDDFDYIRRLLKTQIAYDLSERQEYLVESRLTPLAQEMGLVDIMGLVRNLRMNHDMQLIQMVCEAMTTNETFFFRDKSTFDTLEKQILPELIEKRKQIRTLKIWSSASSSGQEILTILMIIAEHFPEVLSQWNLQLTGTDISNEMVAKASQGTYSAFEVQRGLPVGLLLKYFRQTTTGYQFNPELLTKITFKSFNLIQDYRSLGTFDLIFLRNVMIYFDKDTKSDIFKKMNRSLAKDGYLVLGGTETIIGLTDMFQLHPKHYHFYIPT